MITERAGGVLLHPTSLPGKYGIGTLGQAARDFIDFLSKAKQRYWQVLPLGPTGFADSPYQCFSAHAGNPNMIDLDELVKEKWLDPAMLLQSPRFNQDQVDFDKVQKFRAPLLKMAYRRFTEYMDPAIKLGFRNFLKEHYRWLNDYALFQAIKNHFDGEPWYRWDKKILERDPDTMAHFQNLLREEIEYHKFLQYLFFRQYFSLKSYAHNKSIRIIGDLPIYVALDSADTWAYPTIFELDSAMYPERVGGVPPDYFTEDGQLWGNPLFRWKEKEEEVFQWWADRIETNLNLFDIIRIDHFRGFEAYWAVPATETTARDGEWIEGPGKGFFTYLTEKFGSLPFIAEDLGVITPVVDELRDAFNFPGMKVLSFAFDSSEANNYIPYTYSKNCVVYTGTHDNDTTVGWFESASDNNRNYALEYLNSSGAEIHWEMIRLAWSSVANTAIVPVQDLLGLDSGARMNIPGTIQNNWRWRARRSCFTDKLAERMAHLSILYGRSNG